MRIMCLEKKPTRCKKYAHMEGESKSKISLYFGNLFFGGLTLEQNTLIFSRFLSTVVGIGA
ncbi:MAG: hypothetical protein Kow0037_18070 [Calditrichia bacterium]